MNSNASGAHNQDPVSPFADYDFVRCGRAHGAGTLLGLRLIPGGEPGFGPNAPLHAAKIVHVRVAGYILADIDESFWRFTAPMFRMAVGAGKVAAFQVPFRRQVPPGFI